MKAILVAEQGTADHVGLGLSSLRLASQLSRVGATSQWAARLSSDCGERSLGRVRRQADGRLDGRLRRVVWRNSSLCVSPTSMAVRERSMGHLSASRL